jgi:hypothetical protein
MQHEYDCHRHHLEWHCIYRTCPKDGTVFLSEDDFCAHVVDHHVPIPEDSKLLLIAKTGRRVVANNIDANVDCPVCLLPTPNKRSKLGRHLGRHMEDIALPIISLVVPTDEDTDASEKSDEKESSDDGNPPTDSIVVRDYLDYSHDSLFGSASESPPPIVPERTPSPVGERPEFQASQGDRALIDHLPPNHPDGPQSKEPPPLDLALESDGALVAIPAGETYDPEDVLTRSPLLQPQRILYRTSESPPALLAQRIESPTPVRPFRTSGPDPQPVTLDELFPLDEYFPLNERSLTPIATSPTSSYPTPQEHRSDSDYQTYGPLQ